MLIVHPNWRGDVLFSTALVRALKRRFPHLYICSLVVSRAKEILEGNPDIEEIILQFESRGIKNFFRTLTLVPLLYRKRFDLAFLLTPSFTRSFLLFLANIPLRVGYKRGVKSIFLNKRIDLPKASLHRAEYFLYLSYFLGTEKEKNCYFFISKKEEEWAKRFLERNGIREEDILVILNPGGNWRCKRWPEESFARLGDRIVERYKARIVISGAKKDEDIGRRIYSLMRYKPILAVGKTTLKQLAALCKRAKIVIANDSGPMHIAVAVGSQTIALFGPTSEKITGPYNERKNWKVIRAEIDCPLPCYNLNCPENRCMQAISVDKVLSEIDIDR